MTSKTQADQLVYVGSMAQFHGWIVAERRPCPDGCGRLQITVADPQHSGPRRQGSVSLVHARTTSVVHVSAHASTGHATPFPRRGRTAPQSGRLTGSHPYG